MELRLSVGGDPDGGWLVDIHDGDRNELYRPTGEHIGTVTLAALWALYQHDPSLHGGGPQSVELQEAKVDLAEAAELKAS